MGKESLKGEGVMGEGGGGEGRGQGDDDGGSGGRVGRLR